MALYYSEFDTTVGALVRDLVAQITSSTDWTKISPSTSLGTTSAAVAVGTSSVPLTAGHTVTANTVVALDSGGVKEYVFPYSVSATSMSLNSSTRYAHASGVVVAAGSEILKTTTTRGANIILDLTDGDSPLYGQKMAFYRNHTGAVGGGIDRVARGLWWRSSVGGGLDPASPLHVTVSVGKEHLFVMLEGPRANESGAMSTQVGSQKSYIFACDVVPYNAADTVPQVFCGGYGASGGAGGVANGSHEGNLTRNYANTTSWDPARLGSVQFPQMIAYSSISDVYSVQLQRQSAIDGKWYLFPYVVCSNADGLRGRLASFFNAGYTGQYLSDSLASAPIGAKVTYNGQLYKLLAVDKGNANYNSWAQFGAAPNSSVPYSSNVVAVPCT